jgi:hypothetical protein
MIAPHIGIYGTSHDSPDPQDPRHFKLTGVLAIVLPDDFVTLQLLPNCSHTSGPRTLPVFLSPSLPLPSSLQRLHQPIHQAPIQLIVWTLLSKVLNTSYRKMYIDLHQWTCRNVKGERSSQHRYDCIAP